ncbi:OmpA family protein [Pontibacter sp. G13]|uniref:OmpA family protein n=1 Tax=Pontibacter sp. G13 TaxID=3074898 RepID=UPI00288C31B6|nr:OmpA family protein [Pontibacter sp. G13]WNJ19421.1 OmpA family protein [Pontibacter sp. G13]
MRILLAMLALCLGTKLSGQSSADCPNAILLKLPREAPTFSFPAPTDQGGQLSEIAQRMDCKQVFRAEHHTQWFSFRVPFSGHLGILLTPVEARDDYDFLLYRAVDSDICEQIRSGQTCPERAVVSRNDLAIEGVTGLSPWGSTSRIGIGPGPSFGPLMSVKRGDEFRLVVDNVYGSQNGYALTFSYFFQPRIVFEVIDQTNGDPVNAKLLLYEPDSTELEGVRLLDQTRVGSDGRVKGPAYLEYFQPYQLAIEAKGYFSKKVDLGPQYWKSHVGDTVRIPLFPIREGVVLPLKQVYFEGGTARMLPTSRPELRILVRLLRTYPGVKIRVDGHVNGAGTRSSEKEKMDLSWARSKAVCQYLIDHGIDPDRLTSKGFGDHQMVFPHATSEVQMRQNRRVEVTVMETGLNP